MKSRICKRCKGKGKIPTGAKAEWFMGMNLQTTPPMITCKKCHGKGWC